MNRTLGIFFALVVFGAAPSAKAGGSVNIKCAPNEDRVWVYESLTDFNVATKLKCGDPVQIVGRVKGYVKIETANGTEGYVPDTNFAKSALPPEPVEKPNDVQSAATAFAARRSSRPADYSVDAPPTSAHSSAPVAVASTAPPVAAKPIASRQPEPQPSVTVSAAPSAITVEPVSAAPTAPVVAKNSNPVPSVNSAAVTAPVVSLPQPAPVKSSPPASSPQPAPVSATVAAAPRAPAVVAVSTPAPSVSAPVNNVAVAPVTKPAPVAVAASAPVAVAVAAPPVASDASSMTVETIATVQPVADATSRVAPAAVKPAAKPPVNPDEEEDSAVNALNNEMANCTLYFSAYGLSANQYKWLAQNRHKAFPTVCPAPTPSQVDFVVIFTHDVPFYNVTMPNAVHTDVNGFSDWTPLTTVDTAVISASDADKSHHEYVWVFHTTRGAFDPSRFSARRKPLYSKAETNTLGSRGGFRTVMDALTFIEQNGTNR
jgi:Bacterial SH3 domain